MRFVRFGHLAHSIMLGAVFALAALTTSGRSHACGGCFHEPEPPPQPGQESKSTVIVAHRMAVSISTTQTVLWDQVQYAGSPAAFAWVLPVKAGARLELSTDAWFETLDASTTTRVLSPEVICSYDSGEDFDGGLYDEDYSSSSGCSRGCGAEESGSGSGGDYGYGGTGGTGVESEPPPPVVVVHQATVGPYETVTLHANVPNALPTWLADHGFVVDASVQPIIDTYTAEGFDFIAMRLLPGQGVDRMKPVRVVMPGATPTLPLRMVAAGTGANVGITLFVISEGRYRATNFPEGVIDPDNLTWDFDTSDSNYSVLRNALLAQGGGRTWNTAYAKHGTLLGPAYRLVDQQVTYNVNPAGEYDTIAETYVRQALVNHEGIGDACVAPLRAAGESMSRVVAACDPAGSAGTGGNATGGAGIGGNATGGAGIGGNATGGAGGSAPVATCGANEIDGRTLACGAIDDVAVALLGLHPKSVWLTRLESSLPRAALTEDLNLGIGGTNELDNWLMAADYTGDPCAALGGTPLSSKKRPIRGLPTGASKATIAKGRTPPLGVPLAIAAIALTWVRRIVRKRAAR